MIYTCLQRGKEIQKGYLYIFPLAAGIIDIFLPFFVFIPTAFNVAAISSGFPDGKNAQATSTKE